MWRIVGITLLLAVVPLGGAEAQEMTAEAKEEFGFLIDAALSVRACKKAAENGQCQSAWHGLSYTSSSGYGSEIRVPLKAGARSSGRYHAATTGLKDITPAP